MYLQLDGPSIQDVITVGTSEVEIKVGASPLTERKVITIQPNADIKLLFVSGLPATKGLLIQAGQIATLEATDKQSIYLIMESGSTTVVVIERA